MIVPFFLLKHQFPKKPGEISEGQNSLEMMDSRMVSRHEKNMSIYTISSSMKYNLYFNICHLY